MSGPSLGSPPKRGALLGPGPRASLGLRGGWGRRVGGRGDERGRRVSGLRRGWGRLRVGLAPASEEAGVGPRAGLASTSEEVGDGLAAPVLLAPKSWGAPALPLGCRVRSGLRRAPAFAGVPLGGLLPREGRVRSRRADTNRRERSVGWAEARSAFPVGSTWAEAWVGRLGGDPSCGDASVRPKPGLGNLAVRHAPSSIRPEGLVDAGNAEALLGCFPPGPVSQLRHRRSGSGDGGPGRAARRCAEALCRCLLRAEACARRPVPRCGRGGDCPLLVRRASPSGRERSTFS